MKQKLLIISAALLMWCCKDDESPDPGNANSVAIGDKIYTIEHGKDQSGAKGQYLEEYIKISVTDFEGKPRTADFTFELSDEDGRVESVSEREEGEEDWYVFRWKLGCTADIQMLTIMENLCNISRDGCVDVNIFEIEVSTSGTAQGWVEDCSGFNFENNGVYQMMEHENELLVYTYSNLYSTSDFISNGWQSQYISRNPGSKDVWHYANGDMVYEENYSLYHSTDNGRNWSSMNLPLFSYNNKRVAILEDGTFLYVNESSDVVYKSTDSGLSWSVEIANIEDLTEQYYSTGIIGLTSVGNKAYIITDNYYIIALEDGETEVYSFELNSWNGGADMDDLYAIIDDGQLFLMTEDYNSYLISVVDIESSTVANSLNMSEPCRLVSSDGNIYVIPTNARSYYYRYQQNNFNTQSIEIPEASNSYYSGHLAIFNGTPIYYSGSTAKLYYYNN